MSSPRPLRLPPVPEEEWTGEQQQLVTSAPARSQAAHFTLTLLRNPDICRALRGWSARDRAGRLPQRVRELVILRTAWNTRAEYQWGHHARLARAAGLEPEEIDRVAGEPAAEAWSAEDALVLRVADELHTGCGIGDETWRGLCERYDEAQIIELIFLIGTYHMLAFAENSFGVQLEADKQGFPDDTQGLYSDPGPRM